MYIGKTELIDPYERWHEHCHDYNVKRFEKRPLYDAMQKYGVCNFSFDVIDFEDNSDKLCELEKHYINQFRTYIGFNDCNGYNATLGGDGKCYLKLSEEDVIKTHLDNNCIIGITAKHYNVDYSTIKKILIKNNIKWLTNNEITELKYINQYGGLI